MVHLITDHIDIWTAAQTPKVNGGRGRGNNSNGKSSHGIKKLRELILELAVRGKLVPQDHNDEPASVLLGKLAREKARLIKEGKIKKQKTSPQISEDEKPFNLPDGWEWARLQDVSTYIQRGKGPKYADQGKIQVISQKCIQWSGFDLSQARFVDDSSLNIYQPERFLECNDLLWNSTGTGTVGRINVLRDVEPKTLVADSHVTVIRPLLVSSYFLWCYVATPGIQLRIEPEHENSLVSGTTKQVELNTSTVQPLLVPVPPISEQHRIVAKVDELMALCGQLEQKQTESTTTHQTLIETLLATLTNAADQRDFVKAWQRIANQFDTLFTTEHSIDQLKQAILQLAVMGKLVPQDPNDEPASVLIEKIAKEKARLVEEKCLSTKAKTEIDPEEEYINRQTGWEYCRLGNLAKFIDYRGRTPKKIESGVPLITAKNVRFGFISLEPQEFISDEEYEVWMTRGFPKIGDILFTTEAPLGNVAIVDIEEKFALAQRVICFQLHEPDIAPFLKVLMLSWAFQEKLTDQATGMTATGIKSAKLKEIPVPIPPLAEQHRIVTKVDELMALCDSLKARLNEAQTTQIQLADAIVEQAVVNSGSDHGNC